MTLETLIKELATHYRRYGDVPVLIETATNLLELSNIDVDIFNARNDVTLILETEGVDTTTKKAQRLPEPPTTKSKKKRDLTTSSTS